MISPFLFGKVVTGNLFINRTDEIKRLSINFHSGINTILISPRRWGKSSLVKQVAHSMYKEKNIRFCFIDLFGIKNEEEFYQIYLREVLKCT